MAPTPITAKSFGYLNKALPDLVKEIGAGTFSMNAFLDASRRYKFGKVKPVGRQMEQSVRVLKHSTMVDQLGAGYTALNATTNDPDKTYGFDYATGTTAVRVSGIELRTDSVLDMDQIESNTKSAVEDIMEQFERRVVAGADATFGTSFWTGLATLNGAVVTTGLFENAAFGSQTNTFGLAKATYPLYWQHQRYDATNFATGGVKGFYDLTGKIRTAGGQPKFALLSQNYNTLLSNDRDGKIQYVSLPVNGDAGILVAKFAGCDLYVSPYLGFADGSSNEFSMMIFGDDCIEMNTDSKNDFFTSELTRVSGQDVYEAVVTHRAQWTAKNLRRMGVLVNADA